MKRITFLVALVAVVASAQTRRWLWLEPTGDVGRWLYDQGGGNMVVMGTERATGKALLHGLSTGGVSTWHTTVDSIHDPVLGIGAGGRLFVAGHFPSPYDENAVMTALTAAGGFRWSALYDGPGLGDDEAFQQVIEGSQGTVFAAGYVTPTTNKDIGVFAFDGTDGRLMDTMFYDGPDHGADEPVDMVCSAAGDVYVLGSTYFGGNVDWVVLQWNGTGGSGWTATFNDSGNGDDYPAALAVSAAGNIYSTGIGQPSYNNNDMVVVSMQAASGHENWVYHYHNGGSTSLGRDVVVGTDGNIYAVGEASDSSGFSSLVVVSLTPGGTERWRYRYAPRPMVTAMASAIAWGGDGNIYAFGSAKNTSYNWDMLVTSLTPDGSQRWAYTEDGGYDDYVFRGLYGADGNIYAAGRVDTASQTARMAVLSLNPVSGIEEGGRPTVSGSRPAATVARGVLMLGAVDSRQNTGCRAELLDAAGRKVAELHPGANDVSRLAPGAYILRTGTSTTRVLVVK
ncbi:MAG TPA: hypothetical protein VMH22_06405 [bacterium]|nr:hypothetical protein [bacterium]